LETFIKKIIYTRKKFGSIPGGVVGHVSTVFVIILFYIHVYINIVPTANTSFRETSAVGLDLIWRAASPILEQPPASPAPASGLTTSSSSRWLVTLR
jgi:hypothetical protein